MLFTLSVHNGFYIRHHYSHINAFVMRLLEYVDRCIPQVLHFVQSYCNTEEASWALCLIMTSFEFSQNCVLFCNLKLLLLLLPCHYCLHYYMFLFLSLKRVIRQLVGSYAHQRNYIKPSWY